MCVWQSREVTTLFFFFLTQWHKKHAVLVTQFHIGQHSANLIISPSTKTCIHAYIPSTDSCSCTCPHLPRVSVSLNYFALLSWESSQSALKNPVGIVPSFPQQATGHLPLLLLCTARHHERHELLERERKWGFRGKVEGIFSPRRRRHVCKVETRYSTGMEEEEGDTPAALICWYLWWTQHVCGLCLPSN